MLLLCFADAIMIYVLCLRLYDDDLWVQISVLKGKQNEVVVATKFAAYPWRLTSGQFVNACRSL